MPVPVPSWNARGVIDPANSNSPTAADRSPYQVSLRKFAEAFGVTTERVNILHGLLNYRAALHTAGLVSGFQWLDGSFLEHVEMLEQRAPNDIDLVTFYDMPSGQNQASLLAAYPAIFSPAERARLKQQFHVDAYLQELSVPPARLVSRAIYWYSMWSHRRDLTWKGFVEVSLAPDEDQDTNDFLQTSAASFAAAHSAANIAKVASATGSGKVT